MDRNNELSTLIKQLSSQNIADNANVDIFFKEFQTIYSGNFRHLYSELFSIIIENTEEQNGSLVSNMRFIYDRLHSGDVKIAENVKKSIVKLYDHINLDVARVNYFLLTDKKNETDKKNLTEKLQNEAAKLQKIKQKAQAMQKEYIAILGIFSAIVITVVAGLIFTSSVLENIEKASIYRLLFVVWLVGFILFAILQSLFSFIEHIVSPKETSIKGYTRTEIEAATSSVANTLINVLLKNFTKASLQLKEKRLVIHLFLLGLFIIFVLWFFDVVALRQKVVNKLYNSKIEKTANEIEYEDETYIDNFLQNCIVRDYSGYTFEHIPIGAGKKSIGELYTKLRLRPL